jgi:transcriptional/translational regulatory protein YebC/TACO1
VLVRHAITPAFAQFEHRAATTVHVDEETRLKLEKFFEILEELQDVTDIASNLS